MTATLLCGDVREQLRLLDANSIQCVVTSPPYFGLRDYGVGGQIGLEPTVAEYVATMVDVFREVRRVLRPDGTVWLNLGDSYAAQRGGTHMPAQTVAGGKNGHGDESAFRGMGGEQRGSAHRDAAKQGLKHKDLIGIPWRVAFALQDDGWWLRSDIIWAKPNPMPESVTDRPTRSHEYLFLLTKSARYYYDADAIAEPLAECNAQRTTTHYDTFERGPNDGGNIGLDSLAARMRNGTHSTRNKRTVWTISTQAFSQAHFATFPEKLVEPCILAGSSERGQCPACGVPWRRVVEVTRENYISRADRQTATGGALNGGVGRNFPETTSRTTGWQPSCTCDAGEPVPQTILDPFAGSGTVGVVALRHGRSFVGIDLNPEYVKMARKRIMGDCPLLNTVEVA